MTLLQTPLYSACVEQKARMTAFAGWSMPVQFGGIKQEHQAVRDRAGLFDISHMGKLELKGPGVIAALQRLVPSNLERLGQGQAQYTVLLNPEGGIVDDLIVYLKSPPGSDFETVALIVNAATTDKDKTWLLNHLPGTGIELVDESRDRALISLQGPAAATLLQPHTPHNLDVLGRFAHRDTALLGQLAWIARTGYTGEDGFEIMTDPDTALALWQLLSAEGAMPCGLGARDTLRLEAAMALYGQDIDDTTSPLEAGLNWLVHLDEKGDFVGRSQLEAQKAQGVSRRLVGLVMEGRHIARHGYPVLHQGDRVGTVTSGTLAPTLNLPIALAYVAAPLAKVGQLLEVEVRGEPRPAKVVKRPFYRAK
ncbi:glycine cleavage system aminomethyltransferase GcvT [Nodosilinea sp. LEGE 06152]|uniref:glycine cleavage system aminomethyltransferase GcvT n=1 Tax=Nodosilinea sp. LEGE 06152 TaxID=2777966 RepID=UPI00187E85EE|nr:glycine cleavage system aminomethyltransferase GcvT [Nodosilinea sp. LEGE 06152]MBE9159511.1 glycine cleavage system aminomethyltransferase GcvT [Nodosilinea sp. LEGE 06152]